MASSEVEIYNLALNAIGSRDNISATTEASREAEVGRLWYETSRDQVLRAAPWPSARAYRRLALLKERDFDDDWVSGDPEPGYRYVYSAPADILQPLYISTYVPFNYASHEEGRAAIMTNQEDAILFYNRKQTTVQYWDVQLRTAIVFAFAAFICMPLTGKPARAQRLAEQANDLIREARANVSNASMHQVETLPDWFTMRGYGGEASPQRYIYPYGGLIAVGSNVS